MKPASRNTRRQILQSILAILFAVSSAAAVQISNSGILTGRVTDAETGDVLPSVSITLLPGNLTATSNFRGDFSIISIPAGIYTVKISSLGYRTTILSLVCITPGIETQLSSQLFPSKMETNPDTLILFNTVATGKLATGVFYRLSYKSISETYAERPLDVAIRLPGIDTDTHIRGTRQSDRDMLFDGISIRDPLFGGAPAELFIPLQSLQEIQLNPGHLLSHTGSARSAAILLTSRTPDSVWNKSLRLKSSASALNGRYNSFKLTNRDEHIFEFSADGPAVLLGKKLNLLFAGKTNNQQNRTPGLDIQDPVGNTITDFQHNSSSLYSFLGKASYSPNLYSTITFGGLYGALYQGEDSWLWRYAKNFTAQPTLPSLTQNTFLGYINYSHFISPSLSIEAQFSRYDFQFKHGLIKENLQWLWIPRDVIVTKTPVNQPVQFGVDNPYGLQDIFFDSGLLDSYWSGTSKNSTASASVSYSLKELYLLTTGAELTLYNTSNHSIENTNNSITPLQNNFNAKPYTVSLYYSGTLRQPQLRFDSGFELFYFNPQSAPAAFSTPSSTELTKVSSRVRINPYLGIAVELKNGIITFANLGWRHCLPNFNSMYAPQYTISRKDNITISGNPHLNLQKYTQAEAGIRCILRNNITFTASAYINKLSDGEVADTTSTQLMRIPYYNSTGEADNYGIEINTEHTFTDNLSLSLSYNLTFAKGNFIYFAPYRTISEVPQTLFDVTSIAAPQSLKQFSKLLNNFPLSYERHHIIHAAVECLIPKGKGPTIFGTKIAENTTVSCTAIAESGTPYTPLEKDGTLTGDINTARNPWFINANSRIEKSLTRRIALFIDIRNLFNRVKPLAYYPITSNADNPGKILRPSTLGEFTDPNPSYQYSSLADLNHNGTIEPEEYTASYHRFLQDFISTRPLYSSPREVWIGIKINF